MTTETAGTNRKQDVLQAKKKVIAHKKVEVDGKEISQKKVTYMLMLELLAEHENFAGCTDKNCIQCKEITELGKELFETSIYDFELPKDFSDFTPAMYMDLYTEEIMDKDIQEYYGLTRGTIGRFKKKHHILAGKNVSDATKKEWIKLFEKGMTVEEIAIDYGLAKETVNIYRTKVEKERGVKFARTRKKQYTKVGGNS